MQAAYGGTSTLFVFSEDMSSLKSKGYISSSVYVTIDPGTSSVVASPSFWSNFCLPSSTPRSRGFCAFSLSRAKEVFYASPGTCSSAQSKEEPPTHFEKRVSLVPASNIMPYKAVLQRFSFSWVDNVNWPPQRDSKADVSSVSPSSERIEELWGVCCLYTE